MVQEAGTWGAGHGAGEGWGIAEETDTAKGAGIGHTGAEMRTCGRCRAPSSWEGPQVPTRGRTTSS